MKHRLRTPILVGSSVGALVTGGLYGLLLQSRRSPQRVRSTRRGVMDCSLEQHEVNVMALQLNWTHTATDVTYNNAMQP